MTKFFVIVALLALSFHLVLTSDTSGNNNDDDLDNDEFFDANDSFQREREVGEKLRRRKINFEKITQEIEVESQLSLNPSNSEETAKLDNRTIVFSDYCITSRDLIMYELKRLKDHFVGAIFKMFFRSAEKLGIETLNTTVVASQKLVQQVVNPEAKIDKEKPNINDEQVDRIIVEGQVKIQENKGQPLIKSLFQAFLHVLKAIGSKIARHIESKLREIKRSLRGMPIMGVLRATCIMIKRYQSQFNAEFMKVRSELAEQEIEYADIQQSDVQCLTVKRINNLSRLCSAADATQHPIFQAIAGSFKG